MDELTRLISARLGLEEGVVRKATGALLRFLDEQSGSGFDFNKILSSLPGAEGLMKDEEAEQAVRSAPRASGPSGIFGLVFHLIFSLLQAFGVIAILKKLLTNVFGENAAKMIDTFSDGAQLAAVLGKLGIDHQQGLKMVRMVVDYMKEKVDPETIDKLTEQVPAVKAFLDEEKKEE